LKHNKLAHWADLGRALPNGKALQAAEIDASIWAQVSTALLEARQLGVVYLSRSNGKYRTLHIHPAGMVSRHSVSYLIAQVDGYTDFRQFALHRIHQAICLDAPACEQTDFEIDHFIRTAFNNSGQVRYHELVADVSPQIAWLLNETPICPEQTLEPPKDSDWQRLRVDLPDDQETFWWTFGLGESLRLYEPHFWVEAIKEKLIETEMLSMQPALQCLPVNSSHAYQEFP